MARIRALGVTLAVALLAGVLASAAPASRPTGDHTLQTAHFLVTYHTDVNATTGAPGADYSTETDAGDIAGYAEQAYALYKSWGFTVPPNDGDGHIDIEVANLSGPPAYTSILIPDAPFPSPDTGWFQIATPTQLEGFAKSEGLTLAEEEQREVSIDVFQMFAYATWVPLTQDNQWTEEAASQWAGFVASGYPGVTGSVAAPDIALGCRDNLAAHRMCDPDPYFDSGYSRWAFFQMLANEYGKSFVQTAFANGALGQTATTALANAIASKGSSLATQFNLYAADLMSGNFGVPTLSAVRPTPDASVITGAATATLPAVTVTPANHLAARYVTFQRGDGDGSHACFKATLTVNVSMPSGTSSQPYFLWDVAGNTPQPLSVSGSTASITVPWDTCDWGTTLGWLSLPNASTTVDGATFTVTSSISVDTSTPAAPSSAPAPVSTWGTSVPVPSTDAAPSIDVFGPELLKVDAKSPIIRLIVESSGAGTVNAALGSVALGSSDLRAGENDIRFAVPKGMLASLRRSASAANTLTLTPVSPTGALTGTAVTRTVVITATPKPKPHAKPKPKPKKK